MGLKTGEQVSARFCSMTKFRLNPALTFYIYIYESTDEFLLRCAGGTCEKKSGMCLLEAFNSYNYSRCIQSRIGGTWLSVGTADSTMTAEAETGHQSAGGESVTSGLSRMKGSHHLR